MASEADWQAQDDAWALVRAQQVKDDPARMENAQTKLDEFAKEKADEASAARRAKTGRRASKTSNGTADTASRPPPASNRAEVAVPSPSNNNLKSIMGGKL